MAETLSTIDRFFRARASKSPEAGAQSLAEMLTGKPERIAKEKEIAQNWKEKALSDAEDANVRQRAQEEAELEIKISSYTDTVLAKGHEHLQEVQAILASAGGSAPDWLHVGDISQSPAAAEFAARISELPVELREDPNVLLHEAAKLYWSVKWSEASPDARREVRTVLDRTFEEIRRLSENNPDFGNANRDVLFEGVDHSFDRVHLKTIPDLDIPSAAEAEKKIPRIEKEIKGKKRQVTNRESPEYKAWERVKVKEQQGLRLKNTVETFQQILDLPQNQSMENQREQLQKFIMDLRSGANRAQRIKDIDGDYPAFNREDVIKYIESAQARLNKLNTHIDLQRQTKRAAEDVERGVKAGRMVQWTEELQDIYKHKEHPVGEVLEVGYRLTPEDVHQIVFEGVPGQRAWLARFRERWVGATGEPFKPGLEAETQFQEFMKIVTWLNGEQHVSLSLQYRDLWDLYQDVDSIVKGTLYRPKGQKAVDSFNTLRYLTTTHHEILRSYDLVDIAKPAISESIEDTMRDELFEYQEALNDLQADTVGTDGKTIRKVDRLLELKEKYSAGGESKQYGGLGKAEYDEMLELQTKLDRVGSGVLLRDYHMTAQVEPYNQLNNKYKEYSDLKYDLHADRVSRLTAGEVTAKQNKLHDLQEQMDDLWHDLTRNKHSTFNPDTDGDLLLELRNFSPVEIRARERIVQTLRSDWLRNHDGSLEGFDAHLKKESYKIRDAVWAARTIAVGTGEAMEKGAKMARAAMFDLQFTLGLPKEIKPKHFMDRGFAEAYQRVLNPYIFEEDFHMGSELGETARNLYYETAFNLVGYDYRTDGSMPKAWKDRIKKAEKGQLKIGEQEVPVWVVYSEYAQQVLGMSFTESVRPDLLATGLQQLSTYWRMQRVVLEPFVKDYLKNKVEGQSAEFQAMGLQLAVSGGHNERMQVLRRMIQRKPSIFFKLIGEDMNKILGKDDLKELFPGTLPSEGALTTNELTSRSKNWQDFKDTLALMEMELWRNEAYANKPWDLTNKENFMEMSESAIRSVLGTSANADEISRRQDLYFRAISRVNVYMRAHGANGKRHMDNWADHKFGHLLLLTSSDFNWQKTNFSQLDMYGIERRIGDFQGQYNAEELRREVLLKSEYLSPIPGKETDTLAKIKEVQGAVNGYAGVESAEMTGAALMQTVINFNRNRAIHSPIVGWVPGAVSVMRRMGVIGEDFEVSVGNIKWKWLREKTEGFLEDTHLGGKPLNKWPQSIAQAVSYAVKFGGPEANAWDEYKVAGFIAGAETSMMFVQKPAYLAKMRSKFKTTLGWRTLGVVRKYWWVVPAATLAVATMSALDEEKKAKH